MQQGNVCEFNIKKQQKKAVIQDRKKKKKNGTLKIKIY